MQVAQGAGQKEATQAPKKKNRVRINVEPISPEETANKAASTRKKLLPSKSLEIGVLQRPDTLELGEEIVSPDIKPPAYEEKKFGFRQETSGELQLNQKKSDSPKRQHLKE